MIESLKKQIKNNPLTIILYIPLVIIGVIILGAILYLVCVVFYFIFKFCKLIVCDLIGIDNTLVILITTVVWTVVVLFLRSKWKVEKDLKKTVDYTDNCEGRADERMKGYLHCAKYSGVMLAVLFNNWEDCNDMYDNEKPSDALNKFLTYCNTTGKHVAIMNKNNDVEISI